MKATDTTPSHGRARTRNARPLGLTLAFALLAPALTLGAIAGDARADDFKAAEIFFERNDTDGDTGIQVFLDADGWQTVEIFDPAGNKVFEASGTGSIGENGLVELFFESEEPSDDEVPLTEFAGRFPAGAYAFRATDGDGDEITGEATLGHVLPAGPEIVSPEESAEVDAGGPVVIMWKPVTGTVLGEAGDLEVVAYQVIVETEDPPELGFVVDLPADQTSVTVPAEFLQPGTSYAFEILVEEASGNKTITESDFETE